MVRLEFDALIEAAPRGGGGALVALPPEAADTFGTRARFPVRVTFNGIDYRGSTMPMGDGKFCVGILKAIRSAAGVDIGDAVHVVVERDDEERTVEVPEELAGALADAGLRDRFDAMAFTHRREYAQWVAEAKRPETRHRRVAKAVDMIGADRPLS